MRAYFFVNSALSGIQKGLQVAHCVADLFANFEDEGTHDLTGTTLLNWAAEHKTIIVLEGGFHADLMEIADSFQGNYDHFWAAFREDDETMNEMMTAVGIILPERIYETAERVRKAHQKGANLTPNDCGRFTDWEVELIKLLNSCPLARN
jgi:hypothetical protein